jgi:hypothetical protein
MKPRGNNFVRTSFFFSMVFSIACFFSPATVAQTVEPKAFVYTELQLSAPFDTIPWQNINTVIKQQAGFISKTWLSGVGNNSGGGFYAFDSIENAQKFVTGYFPAEAKHFGVAQTTRVFDAVISADASRAINSVYFGGKLIQKPAAFVYTELQVRSNPFSKNMWSDVNTKLAKQPGLLTKTWLIGINTGSTGGFFAFDTLEHAQNFALNDFPAEAKTLNAAFTARIFDATKTEAASQDMASPFYPIQTQ